MDISLTEDQQLIASTALAFATDALTADRIRALETTDDQFDHATWKQMVDMGWAGAVFPAEYGGSDFSLFELALIVEALGQGAIPSPLYSTVVEAGLLLLDAGASEQRSHWLPRIADGRALLTVASAEPGGGLDPAQWRTRIVRSGSGYEVSGTKLFVRDAGVAQSIICAASAGSGDITLAAIAPDATGVTRRRLPTAGNESLWEVTFDKVKVAADAIVGTPGAARPAIERMQLRMAAMKAAELVGIGQTALDLTVAYAKGRIQVGKPIGSFQAVHHHCTDMYRDVIVSRLLSWQAAASLAAGKTAAREVSMAKAKASDVIPQVTRLAHQIHGAAGYYRDYPLELYYHRALAAAATCGDADHHRRSLSTLLHADVDAFRGDHRHELPAV